MRRTVRECVGRGLARCALLLGGALALAGLPRVAAAQNQISVPFTNGFVGTRSSSAGTADSVKTFATLGIARTFFIQQSSGNQFELQGNDIPGTLRIVRTNGSTIDMPASANWRNNGNTTYLIGILPRPAAPVTLAYPGGSIQITNGSSPGGSSVGAYVAAYQGAVAADGANESGNAAQAQVLGGLNAYLATVVSSRPAGPVTVTAQSTTSTTPTVAGTATLAAGEQLAVVVNGVEYTSATSPAVVRSGTAWSLALAAALGPGTYDVSATITDTDGFTLSDATAGELVITASLTTATLGGGFTAADKVYDGTTAAAGSTGGLTLAGVQQGDQVTIAGATLAFQTAAAGAGKTVVVAAVVLGGADAARYQVSLAGAPTAAAAVTPRPLSVAGLTVAPKTYDGTTAATLAGTAAYGGLAAGESFAVAGTPAAEFASAAAGASRPVTVTGFAAPNANYAVAQPAGLAGAIAPRTLTVGGTFAAADRAFDGTTAATITSHALQLVGVVQGDVVALDSLAAAFGDAAVGANKPVTLAAAALVGAARGNYALSLTGAPTTTAGITAAAPPSAPQAVVATAGDAALSLAWAAPASAGCTAVSGYVAEYSGDGGSAWTRVAVAGPSPATLAGLVNNLDYRVRVAAVNACGTGPFAAAAGPTVPVAPTRDGAGQLVPATPGTATSTAAGAPRPATLEVVQDTVLRLSTDAITLRLRALDAPGAAIPVDSTRTVLLEQGGRAATDGVGFTPGSYVTAYLYAAGRAPLLLGAVPVAQDGSFAASLPVPDTLAAGDYTLQVNGVDHTATSRAVGIGVEVAGPPPELELAATPDERAPAAGDTVTITLVVTNVGRGPAVDVVIPRAFREPGFAVVRAAPLEGAYNAATHDWAIRRIERGAQARLRLTAVVLPPDATPATQSAVPSAAPAPSSAPQPHQP